MKINFKKSYKQDDREREETMPISLNDARILSTITSIFSRLNKDELVEIMEKYKVIPDKEIWNALEEWLVNHNYEIEEEEENKRKMFIFCDEILDVKYISRVKSYDDYDDDSNEIIYKIVINPTYGDVKYNMYENLSFSFVTEKLRNFELIGLKTKMELLGVKFL